MPSFHNWVIESLSQYSKYVNIKIVHVTQLKTKEAIPMTIYQYRYIAIYYSYIIPIIYNTHIYNYIIPITTYQYRYITIFTIYLSSYGIVLTNRTIRTSKIVIERKYDIMKICILYIGFFILNDIKDEIKHK